MNTSQLALLTHVVLAVGSMAVYLVIRPPFPKRLDGRTTAFRLAGGWAYWASAPILKLAAALGVTPNGLTVLGVFLSFVAGLVAALGYFAAAGMLLIWSSLCDMLDGELARATGAARPDGAFLDSSLDRLGEIGLLAGIAAGLPSKLDALGAFAAVAASLMVSYARARGEGLGVDCPKGGLERPHRLGIYIASLLASAFLPIDQAFVVLRSANGLVALGAGATAIGRILSIRAILQRRSAAAVAEAEAAAVAQPEPKLRASSG
jgi:CDP-diacylglycerol--glycerol-3-phosphate 3-phosphatidyltransferase